MSDSPKRQQGFAAVETLLIVVIIAAVVGVGYWVYKQRNKNDVTATNNSQTTVKAAAGTTSSVDQLTQADSQAEATIDKKYAANEQSNATSTNAALKNLGGAYDETSY